MGSTAQDGRRGTTLRRLGEKFETTLWLFSTAFQLEAGDPSELRHDGRHTHWKLARWARRLGAASSFPLSPGGEVGVPSPGLYLVFAQVSYLDKSKQVGFSIEVNARPKVACSERR